nr:hypothetical protein [Tanacetum cinerariifolium]
MSHRSSSHANDSTSESQRILNYTSYPYPAYDLEKDSLIDSEYELEASSKRTTFMLLLELRLLKNPLEDRRGLDVLIWILKQRRSTRSNTANSTNPLNAIEDEVARQRNTASPNLLTQLVQPLGGNRANQREVTQSCSIKTFRAFGAKKFFGTEVAVGLLTWFESIKSVLYITNCPVESQFKFASSMLHGRTLTWWNTLVQTRGRAAAIAQPWEDLKKLQMEEYCPDDEIQNLKSEFWNHKMVGTDINGYTARFHELARLVTHMVTPESQRVNRYIQGLVPKIKAHVTSSKSATI